MTQRVFSELSRPCKRFFAHLAAVQAFAGMDPLVNLEDSQLGETFVTMLAGVGSFASVCAEMQLEHVDPGETALIDVAKMRTFLRVPVNYVASLILQNHARSAGTCAARPAYGASDEPPMLHWS